MTDISTLSNDVLGLLGMRMTVKFMIVVRKDKLEREREAVLMRRGNESAVKWVKK